MPWHDKFRCALNVLFLPDCNDCFSCVGCVAWQAWENAKRGTKLFSCPRHQLTHVSDMSIQRKIFALRLTQCAVCNEHCPFRCDLKGSLADIE
jgi:hypothetical protein